MTKNVIRNFRIVGVKRKFSLEIFSDEFFLKRALGIAPPDRCL